jgi:hypothetical protein
MSRPYPISRRGTSSRMLPSPGSSSQDTATSQRYPAPLQPRTSRNPRSELYAQEDNVWGFVPEGRVGSKDFYEEEVNSDFDRPQPLSYPYASFVNDMRTISMPDLNEFVGPVIARSNAREVARQPRENTRPAPYPMHDQDVATYSGDGAHRAYSDSIRQPIAEDFLRPQHPLPPPPIEEYESDQDLPIIEPDSHEYFFSAPKPSRGGIQSYTPDSGTPTRRSTTANVKSHRIFGLAPAHKRSQSVLIRPSHALYLANAQSAPELQITPVRVNTMSSDMYQPALGGLQRISGIQRKVSKRDCVKRFIKGMNPFRRQREFGRACRI